MRVWINHELVESDIADLGSDGWPNGEGIFETIRTENGEVFELGRHMRRAIDASSAKGFSLPSEEQIRSGIELLLSAEPHKIGRLRLLFAKDRFIAMHHLYEDLASSASLMIASDSNQTGSISSKTYPYEHRLSLLRHANAQGFDEIICVNARDEITEGAVSNLVFRLGGEWVTPPLSSGILPGIQRGIVIERCEVLVRQLLRSDLEKVDAAFLISSLKIARSVATIAGKPLQIDEDCTALAANIRANTHKHSVG